jgi:xylan 1,4-beta-xylosidase
MRTNPTLRVLLPLLLFPAIVGAQPKTFCNPIDLDYGLSTTRGKIIHRHGADPVVVLYKDKYWLFSTWDKPGYRVSDDLATWRYIPFGPEVELPAKTYTAAAVVVVDDWLYFTEFGRAKQRVGVYRTQDPASGKWEKVASDLPPYADPCLFVDPPSGRLFMYHGLEQPIRGVELDKKTFAEIPGSAKQLMEAFDPKKKIRDGWEVCTWDNSETSKGMRGNKTFFPCREGSWMTFRDGKYYLQYASPGTTVPGYADGLLTSDSPLGPFTYSEQSPISRKASGFITSAGHSNLFQDKYGNWWRAVTMLIGVNERMERRIGIYPAGFDKEGVPYTRTELGDLPITLADGPRNHLADVYAGWWRLPVSDVTASSSLEDHAPALAADENVRTWFSAQAGGREWLQIDLGEPRDVRAIQINFAEQDVDRAVVEKPDMRDWHRFSVGASLDGVSYTTLVDRTGGETATPNFYQAFDAPVKTRYLKLRNDRTPAGGKFAVGDFRAFGVAAGDPPTAVEKLTAARDAADRRKVTLTWTPASGAGSYLVRYGIAPTQRFQHDLVVGGEKTSLTLFNLNDAPPYFFRIDALNASGRTKSEAFAEAP